MSHLYLNTRKLRETRVNLCLKILLRSPRLENAFNKVWNFTTISNLASKITHEKSTRTSNIKRGTLKNNSISNYVRDINYNLAEPRKLDRD